MLLPTGVFSGKLNRAMSPLPDRNIGGRFSIWQSKDFSWRTNNKYTARCRNIFTAVLFLWPDGQQPCTQYTCNLERFSHTRHNGHSKYDFLKSILNRPFLSWKRSAVVQRFRFTNTVLRWIKLHFWIGLQNAQGKRYVNWKELPRIIPLLLVPQLHKIFLDFSLVSHTSGHVHTDLTIHEWF